MKRSYRGASIGVAMTSLLGMFALLSLGCGTIDANGFLGLETCDILNCDGLFFANLADDHDDMAGMEGMDGMDDAEVHDDAEAHDDAEVHDDEEIHDDASDDQMMDSVDDHDDDDAEEEEHDDATEHDNES